MSIRTFKDAIICILVNKYHRQGETVANIAKYSGLSESKIRRLLIK